MIPEGYEMKFTFFSDFNIANAFGMSAITDTAKRVFNEWKDNEVAMSEFVFVLNISCWHFNIEGNKTLSELYHNLYYEYHDKCMKHLKGDALRYYLDFLDQSDTI